VRSNPDLMNIYIQLFTEKFGRKPDCAGCTFNRDWQRLTNYSLQKSQTMYDKTFRLKKPGIIYSYDVKDKKSKRSFRKRVYGNVMTEDFAIDYLTIGTKAEIEERKKQFAELPEKFRTDSDSEDDNDLSKLKVADLKDLASAYPEEEWKQLKKDELIAYLSAKDADVES